MGDCETAVFDHHRQQLKFKEPQVLGAVTALISVTFVNSIASAFFIGFLPQAITSSDGFDMSTSDLGVISGIQYLAFAVGSPFATFLSARTSAGDFVICAVGLLITFAGTLCAAFCDGLILFILSFCLLGVGSSFVSVCTLSVFVANIDDITDLIALNQAVSALGFVVATSTGSVVYEHFGFKTTFISFSMFILFALFLFSAVLAVNLRRGWNQFDSVACIENDVSRFAMYGPILKTFIRLDIASMLLMCLQALSGYGAILNLLGPHLEMVLQVETSTVGFILASGSVFFSIVGLCIPTIARKIGLKTCAVLSCFLVCLSYAFMGPLPGLSSLVSSKWQYWILTCLCLMCFNLGLGFAVILFVPLVKCVIGNSQDSKLDSMIPSVISTVFNMTYNLGGFLGPVFAGVLMEYAPRTRQSDCVDRVDKSCSSGIQWTSLILGLCSACCGLMCAFALRHVQENSAELLSQVGDEEEDALLLG
eukprot:TRINITY_DN6614_c0_g1_i1.p1 TRINITY_DN6614_c0_g1~~TRINITY_DN6614_c0_g1_i1.p1  ORF type:complete len:502 (+),score=118.87 TRINITY_DN6614_c0_g1_i1:71-1507(+)